MCLYLCISLYLHVYVHIAIYIIYVYIYTLSRYVTTLYLVLLAKCYFPLFYKSQLCRYVVSGGNIFSLLYSILFYQFTNILAILVFVGIWVISKLGMIRIVLWIFLSNFCRIYEYVFSDMSPDIRVKFLTCRVVYVEAAKKNFYPGWKNVYPNSRVLKLYLFHILISTYYCLICH